MNEYITFLESLIMSTTIIDKKYKDGVLGCVSMIDIHDNSADEANQAAGKSKKRKRSKKMKPGKNGLYPLEDTLIRKWWASYDDEVDSGIPGTSKDDMIRNRISELKIRETQLQMIVMLEVLALHPLASASDDLDDGLPAELPASQIADGKEKVARHKKPDHLSMLIDVHVDRLCIWQSIALEAVKTPLNNETNQDESLGSSSSTHVDSILRDFCIDIIVPL
jgi:DNA replication regulator SLD3